MVIIAVLMLVAVPGYQEGMKKSRRADAMRDLMELASRQERFYAQNSSYTPKIKEEDGLNFKQTTRSGDHYDLRVESCVGDEDDFSTCYVLKAVPKGIQAKDTACATLSVNSKGERSASGNLKDTCW